MTNLKIIRKTLSLPVSHNILGMINTLKFSASFVKTRNSFSKKREQSVPVIT
jgi:hypothetical protein